MEQRPGRRLTVVTNIPTPYRIHSFAALERACRRRGIAFNCLFMAGTEHGRFWKVDPSQWPFEGRIARGLHPPIAGTEMHLNPGIWGEILHRRPTWLLMAGGWALPTTMGLCLMRPLYSPDTKSLFWAEANHHFSTHQSGPYAWMRKKVLESLDALVIPGELARETLQDRWKVGARRFMYYPNLVDETRFRDRVSAMRAERDSIRDAMGVPRENKVLFWSARLDERMKGIRNFLNVAAEAACPELTIVIAGDGPDRAEVDAWVRARPSVDVRVLGHVSEQQVMQGLASADAGLLPSLRDPNPLSVIEALWSGLPMIMSTHCGNWPEAVIPGENGWVVDPEDPDSMRDALMAFCGTSRERLETMGRRSRQVAEAKFATGPATERLLDGLEAMLNTAVR